MKLILNSPCFPKRSYHVGNAVSQITTDVVYRNLKQNGIPVKYVYNAWNLHGKVPEKLCAEVKGRVCTYDEIHEFVSNLAAEASLQKSYFTEYEHSTENDLIEYIDTNSDFMSYCTDLFLSFVSAGWIVVERDDCYLDLSVILNKIGSVKPIIDQMNVFPAHHKNTIAAIESTINGRYPITKKRVFSVSVTVNGKEYSLNPIFQSLVMPLYLSKKYGTDYPAYFLASAAGRNLLKWHYIRTAISWMVAGKPPYENLLLYGSIVGDNGKPLSKHDSDVTQPSDLFEAGKTKSFVRYALLKTLSANNISIQITSALSEYKKIAKKVDLLGSGNATVCCSPDTLEMLDKAQELLNKFMIKQALELFYLALRKSEISTGTNDDHHNDKLLTLYKTLLSPSF